MQSILFDGGNQTFISGILLPVPNRSAVFHRIMLGANLIDESVHVTKFWRAKF